MKIGFSGTRKGMSEEQIIAFIDTIRDIDTKNTITEFHHGDCIGSDEQAHNIVAKDLNYCNIYVHSPIDNKKRAYCSGFVCFEPEGYLKRNKIIVDVCDLLIAAPLTDEIKRSGTWSTIRYARKKKKSVIIITRDGRVIKI